VSESLVTTIEDASIGNQSEVLASAKRQRWFELLLVLLVSFGGFFLNSLYLLRYGPSAAPNMSSFRWTIGILHEITALILLGYVLSRRRLKFKDLGLNWSLRCVGAGFKLIFVSYLVYGFGAAAVRGLQYAILGSVATGPTGKDFFAHPSVAAVPFFLLNPFFEELIVRAYLMTEITSLTGSSALAVVASVLVQFSYHLYYGWVGALSLCFPFLIFALYYAHSRRALPVILAHEFFDILGLIHIW
jgi:membrane protease YdiL (CAAX protease family)